MKYEQIFQDVMKQELKTAQGELAKSETGSGRISSEWAAIYGSLTYPSRHPKSAYRMIQKTFVRQYQISYDDYLAGVRSANLDAEEKRFYVLGLARQGISWMKQALDGDREAFDQYAELLENMEPRDPKDHRCFLIGKSAVVYLTLLDRDLNQEAYRPIAAAFGEKYCSRLLRSIRDRIAKECGFRRRRKNTMTVLENTVNTLTEISQAAEGVTFRNELEELRFTNENYANSIELLQAMLDELKENIGELAEDAKNEEIVSFYSRMNSDAYGNLLDSIGVVDARLAELKGQKITIPAQLLPLTIVFRQLVRFIRDSGVMSIDTRGREFTAGADELAAYTYIGEPYTEQGEKKLVTVERPGWKFRETVISLPTVREKEEEEN